MKKIVLLLAMTLLLVTAAAAQGQMSVVLTRTNPGIVGKKTSELIFSVANMDTEHRMEGFMLCRTPDDARVTAAFGAGVGDAAQYMSPTIVADTAPYLKTMSITLEADSPGDKTADCTFKYIPFKVVSGGAEEVVEDFTETATITTLRGDVQGHNLILKSFTEAVEATNETEAVEAQLAKAEIEIEGTIKEIEVGSSVTVGTLKVTLNSATAENAEVSVEGTTVVAQPGEEIKQYLLMNGKYKATKADMDYRLIRLDKTVPFVTGMEEPGCPEGTKECKSSEVIDIAGTKVPILWIVIGVILIVLIVAYLLGKTAKH